MKTWYITASALVAVTLGGCGSVSSGNTPATTAPSAPAVSTTAPASVSTKPCTLKDTGDVIYWMRVPRLPDSALVIGSINQALCAYSYDQSLLDKITSQTAGYCTVAASVAANPGYNADATPAKRPKNELAQTGPAC